MRVDGKEVDSSKTMQNEHNGNPCDPSGLINVF